MSQLFFVYMAALRKLVTFDLRLSRHLLTQKQNDVSHKFRKRQTSRRGNVGVVGSLTAICYPQGNLMSVLLICENFAVCSLWHIFTIDRLPVAGVINV